jgi:hypothetical protein
LGRLGEGPGLKPPAHPKNRPEQAEKQIPPLHCGMTTREARARATATATARAEADSSAALRNDNQRGKSKYNCKGRSSACGEG